MEWLMFLLVSLQICTTKASFNPLVGEVDAYGIKIAGNDILFVQANAEGHGLLIRMAPYNTSDEYRRCVIYLSDPSHYIYSVGVGTKQNDNGGQFLYYAGEVVPEDTTGADHSGFNETFIAVMINLQQASNSPAWCSLFKSESIEHISSYGHQEYFVIAVEPYGQYAIGLATDFVFRYRPFPNSTVLSLPGSDVWPKDSTFQPYAADAAVSFTIVVGFTRNSLPLRVRATPTVHLLSNDNLTVIDTWTYTPPENSWQSYLTYVGIDKWNKKFTMSVKINTDDPTRVLIGMPFLNTVFSVRREQPWNEFGPG